jgi:hypothetical protein
MKGWLHRIRGAIGIGLTWAVGWAPIGAVLGFVLYRLIPGLPNALGGVMVLNAATFAALGFLGGIIFSGVLHLTEGHRRFDELSLPKFAGWGAIGGLLLGGVAVGAGLWGGGFGVLGVAMMAAATCMGAASAAASLAVAQAADDQGNLPGGQEGRGGTLKDGSQDNLLEEGGWGRGVR